MKVNHLVMDTRKLPGNVYEHLEFVRKQQEFNPIIFLKGVINFLKMILLIPVVIFFALWEGADEEIKKREEIGCRQTTKPIVFFYLAASALIVLAVIFQSCAMTGGIR